jgi:hypothetical protein
MELRGYVGGYVLVGVLQLTVVGCGLDEAEELLGTLSAMAKLENNSLSLASLSRSLSPECKGRSRLVGSEVYKELSGYLESIVTLARGFSKERL